MSERDRMARLRAEMGEGTGPRPGEAGMKGERGADNEPLPEQVHIAGPDVSVNGVQRQRCAWCGALLLEYDLANIMVRVEPGETAMAPAMFAPGVHVRVAGVWPVMKAAVEPELHPPDHEHPRAFVVPENSCMGLDPDVTR